MLTFRTFRRAEKLGQISAKVPRAAAHVLFADHVAHSETAPPYLNNSEFAHLKNVNKGSLCTQGPLVSAIFTKGPCLIRGTLYLFYLLVQRGCYLYRAPIRTEVPICTEGPFCTDGPPVFYLYRGPCPCRGPLYRSICTDGLLSVQGPCLD